jgi:hypothetical protein
MVQYGLSGVPKGRMTQVVRKTSKLYQVAVHLKVMVS